MTLRWLLYFFWYVHFSYFYYIDDIQEAYNLIKDLEPTTPQEYILKGVVNAALGQDQGSVSFMSIDQLFFPMADNNKISTPVVYFWLTCIKRNSFFLISVLQQKGKFKLSIFGCKSWKY